MTSSRKMVSAFRFLPPAAAAVAATLGGGGGGGDTVGAGWARNPGVSAVNWVALLMAMNSAKLGMAVAVAPSAGFWPTTGTGRAWEMLPRLLASVRAARCYSGFLSTQNRIHL